MRTGLKDQLSRHLGKCCTPVSLMLGLIHIICQKVETENEVLQDLWVYQLPEHAHFYIELVSTMTAADAQHATVKARHSCSSQCC